MYTSQLFRVFVYSSVLLLILTVPLSALAEGVKRPVQIAEVPFIDLRMPTVMVAATDAQIEESSEAVASESPARPTKRVSSCAHLTNVNVDYIPWVEAAADKWLGGDSNILYALIQTESKWDASAKNRSSSASGLGQFINATARAYPEFVGGSDVVSRGKRITDAPERIWEPGTIFDDPKKHFPDDARFSPERSIYAVAHKISGALARNPDLLQAYALGYHGFKSGDEVTKSRAYGAGNRVVDLYKKLQKNGGCTVLEAEV